MSDRNTPDTENGAIKDPAEWATGDEPDDRCGRLPPSIPSSDRTGEEEPEVDLTKAEASMKIDELREMSGVDDTSKKRKVREA